MKLQLNQLNSPFGNINLQKQGDSLMRVALLFLFKDKTMSYTKRFLEKVSIDMGFGGKINDIVLKKASELLADGIDSVQSITELYENLKTEHENDETPTSDSSMDSRETS